MATLYFKLNIDNLNWNTLGNWYQDSNLTIPATALPTSSDDVVIQKLSKSFLRINLSPSSTTTIASLTVNGLNDNISNDFRIEGYPAGRDSVVTFTVLGNITINNSSLDLSMLTRPAYNSYFNISSSNITLNGYSYYSPKFNSSSVTLNDFSYYNGYYDVQVGNIIFNDYSRFDYIYIVYNDITFNDYSTLNNYYSTIDSVLGNMYYTNSSYLVDGVSPVRLAFRDSTGPTFTSASPVNFTINSDSWSFNTSSWTFTNPSPTWTFNNSSYLNNGYIVGDTTFNNTSYQTGNSTFSSNKNINFNDSSHQDGTITNGNITFNDDSYQDGSTINANVTYDGLTGYNNNNNNKFYIRGKKPTAINIEIVVSEGATFNNISANFNTITGNAEFNNKSVNAGTITGNAVFNSDSFNIGTVDGDATFNNNSANYNPDNFSNRGTVYGTISPNILAYFNSITDNDWNNINNWWKDSNCTKPVNVFPTTTTDVVFAPKARCLSNSGSYPTVKSLTLN